MPSTTRLFPVRRQSSPKRTSGRDRQSDNNTPPAEESSSEIATTVVNAARSGEAEIRTASDLSIPVA